LLDLEIILEKISEITLQIQQGRVLESILQWAVDDTRVLLQTDRVLIYQVLHGQDAVVTVESVGAEWTPIIGQLIYDPCFGAIWIDRYEQGQTTSISDVHSGTVSPCYVQLLEGIQVQANLVAPILSQGNLWGLLISHYCRSPRQWQSLEVNYFQQVALHLGLAVQQAELRQSHAHLKAELEEYTVSKHPPTIFQGIANAQSEPKNTYAGHSTLKAIETAIAELKQAELFLSNITERRAVEPALKEGESETLFRVMSDCAPVMIWMSGIDGLCNFFNQGWLDFTGRSLEQELGHGWAEGVHPDDLQQYMDIYLTAFDARQPFKMEYRLRQADREYRWILDHGTPRFTPNGQFAGFIGSCIDISDRRIAEATLRESEAQYRHLINHLNAGFVVHAPDTHIVRCNTTACVLLGLSMDQMLGKTAIDSAWHFIREDGSVMPLDEYPVNRVLSTHAPLENYVLGISQNAESQIWVLVTAFPEFDTEGQLKEIVVMFIDMSDRKAAEVALHQSQHQWYTLFHTLEDFLLVVDAADGRLLTVNSVMAERLGYSRSELLTMRVLDLHPPERRYEAAEIVAEMLAGQRSLCTIPLMAKDGSYISVETKVKLDTWEGRPALLAICRDVSDRIAAEAAFRQSEARWQFALEGAGDGVWDWDTATNTVFFSPQWKAMLGYAEDEIGNTFEEWDCRVHPDDRDQSYAYIAEHFSGQTPIYQNEHRLRCKDGSYKWILARGQVIEWTADGNPLRLIGTHTDMSDRKQAEAQLQSLSDRLNLAVQAAKIGIWDLDLVKNHLIWDDQMYALYGIHPTDFSGAYEAWIASVHPDDLQRCHTAHQQALTGERDFDLEFRVVWPDGTIRYLEGYALVQRSTDGQPLRMIGINQDISDRKQINLRLQSQSTALDACADIIMITNNRGIIEWVNPAFTEVTGFSLQEAIGKNPGQLVKSGHHSLAFYQSFWETILSGETWRGEMMNRRKDGSLYIEAETITPIYGHQQQISHFIAIKQDITERKRLEKIAHQQVVTERMMNQVSQQISQSLDLTQILDMAVTGVRQFLQTDRVFIYRLNPDWTGVVVAESAAPGWPALLDMEMTDYYFVETQGDTYHDNHINVVADVYAAGLSSCDMELLERLQVKAKLVLPISHANQTWGLLIAHQCRSTREWQLFEVELMSQLATRMTIAIQQAELYQQVQTLNAGLELQVQQRTAQLQQALEFEDLLKRITDQVRDSLDEEQILRCVVQELTIAMNADGCDTAIYNSERTTTTVKYEYNQDGHTAQESVYLIADCSDPHLYVQLLQGKYCHFCLIGDNIVRPDQPPKTILACPIVDDQGVLGDMWLFKPSDQVFNDLEIRLVQQVANQCAIALRQSRLYQAAQAQVQELERLNHLKDDFLSTVSHELRSPMANIKMATQMLEISLKSLGVLDDESSAIHRYFKVLREEGQREANLINDLLDLARLDSSPEPLSLIPIDLQIYIPRLAEPFIERTRQQQQQLVLHIPDNLPPFTADLPCLERILAELLHNACKYTPVGETIMVSAQSTGATLEIRISNSGVEISATECDRIFDKFYRIPNNDPWKHGGTGLGLALVKKLTNQLGGTIHVESSCGQTTFILAFGVFPESLGSQSK
jgi:PAS domain S-box-containing protein